MAVRVNSENEENRGFSQIVNDFFLARKTLFLGILAVLFLVVIAIAVFTGVSYSKRKAAYESIDACVNEWLEMYPDEIDSERESEIIAELETTAAGNRGNLAGARANMSVAGIYFSKKDWTKARDFYVAAADASGKFYLTGLAYFNAGVCADEMGLADEAVDFFSQAVNTESFTQKPRAQFNIARVQEQNSRIEEALASYNVMLDLYPDSEWTDLAHSRIIALEILAEK